MAELRAVLYARVSTDDEEDQDPETQLRALRPYVTEEPKWRIVGEETDRGSSDPAHKKRRWRDPPGLAKSIRMIEDQHADVLAVFGADRLGPSRSYRSSPASRTSGARCRATAMAGTSTPPTTIADPAYRAVLHSVPVLVAIPLLRLAGRRGIHLRARAGLLPLIRGPQCSRGTPRGAAARRTQRRWALERPDLRTPRARWR